MNIKRLSIKQSEIEADDLLIEILLRLPSVDRFSSVCKQWHALITNPGFRKLWQKRNFKPASGLVLVSNNSMYKVRFTSDNSKTILWSLNMENKIEQSCNGLFLCSTGLDYHVYNPTTKTSRTLPKLDSKTWGMTCKMSLAYDPVKSPYYKVIASTALFRAPYDNMTQIHIYSSSTRRWTRVLEHRGYLNDGVYWNGSIHYIHKLLYFNIENRTMMAMPAPPDTTCNYLGESCGRLSYVTISKSTPCFIDVYELKMDYSKWNLKYHVILENCNGHFYTTTVLSVVHGLEDDDSFVVLRISEKIVRLYLVSKTSEELHDGVSPSTTSVRAFQYVESLCRV